METLKSFIKDHKIYSAIVAIMTFLLLLLPVAGAIGSAVSSSSAASSSDANICVTWESSADGQVINEAKAYGWGCDRTTLRTPPQEGGVYTIDSVTPPHGNQVCSVSGGAPGYKSTDIIYTGTTGASTEAENLCASMKSAVNQGAS